MKDAFWLQHDSNSADDPKCMMLIEQLGLEGYGIFWVLAEKLRDQPDYRLPLKMVPALSRRYNTTSEKMMVVIKNYDLFVIQDDTFFYSKALINRMEVWEKKKLADSQRGRKAIQARWDKYASNTQVIHEYNTGISVELQNDTITEHNNTEHYNTIQNIEREKKTRFAPPSLDDVIQKFSEKLSEKNLRNYSAAQEAQKFINHYTSNGWMVGKNKMKDWKAAVSNWITRLKPSESTYNNRPAIFPELQNQ